LSPKASLSKENNEKQNVFFPKINQAKFEVKIIKANNLKNRLNVSAERLKKSVETNKFTMNI
jgi:hypothetical protein